MEAKTAKLEAEKLEGAGTKLAAAARGRQARAVAKQKKDLAALQQRSAEADAAYEAQRSGQEKAATMLQSVTRARVARQAAESKRQAANDSKSSAAAAALESSAAAAALVLQTSMRGMLGRQKYRSSQNDLLRRKEESTAARKVQSLLRGQSVRRLRKEESKAALTMQANLRGHRDRLLARRILVDKADMERQLYAPANAIRTRVTTTDARRASVLGCVRECRGLDVCGPATCDVQVSGDAGARGGGADPGGAGRRGAAEGGNDGGRGNL
eukprot:407776-Prymnesium_polylepis.1